MTSPVPTTIRESYAGCQSPNEAADLLTLTEAARIISQASGARITYADLYKRFLARVHGPSIKLISIHRGRTRNGRPIPTKCIRRSDLWALAAHLGYELSVVTAGQTSHPDPSEPAR